LNVFSQNLHRDKQKLLVSYQLVHDKLTVQTILFSFLGIMMFGAVMTIFFARLTWDIRRAGMRAMAIVKGYRGASLEVTRGDEVGGLMRAINQMQSELRERERQLELSRQQQFHHEKMAAVGSLAAAVAHEVNNPIMAITGLAQVMIDEAPGSSNDVPDDASNIPAMILDQAKRLSTITRHISEFATPQAHDPQLVDLNSIVRSTTNFVRFDQRYRRIELQVLEDKQLGAVFAVADHVAQILINLMINAADALEEVTERKPLVTVATTQLEDSVELSVKDNGCGMTPDVLNRACDEFFTTKQKGRGSGLGLFLSKKLLEQNRAALTIRSEPGVGTHVVLRFPIPDESEV
jgi:signal transduction histidine kinase